MRPFVSTLTADLLLKCFFLVPLRIFLQPKRMFQFSETDRFDQTMLFADDMGYGDAVDDGRSGDDDDENDSDDDDDDDDDIP